MTPLHQAHLTPNKYSISNSCANHKKIIQQYLIRGLSTNGIWGTKIVDFQLIIFKTSNPDFHFFHTMNEFIFVELPHRKIALFYFFTKQFKTEAAGFKEAMKIIKVAY
jgi:hypothetical protein